jgi:hypothetical protein
MARGTANPLDPTLVVGTVRDTFERVLANQLRLAPLTADNFDCMSGDEASSELAWQAPRSETPPLGPRIRREQMVQTPAQTAALERAAADRVALDRCFAETADAMDQIPEDE